MDRLTPQVCSQSYDCYRQPGRRNPQAARHSQLSTAATAFLAALFGCSAIAARAQAASKTMPDAQVEANILKALAATPDLASQPITTTTVYGVVTLSGSVPTEALRTEAENIAARTAGVQKVVDELTLGAPNASAQPASGASSVADATQPALQSDGTMAPPAQGQAPVTQGSPESDNTAPSQAANGQPGNPSGPYYGPGAPEYRQPYGAPQQQPSYPQQAQGYPQQPGYPQQAQGYPQQPGYPQQAQGYPQQPGYAQPPQGYPAQPGYYNAAPAFAGQQAGETVTIPSGALVRMRINQSLDTSRTKPGDRFDGIVINDVVADGAVAIPRGASVQGVVVDSKKSGAVGGRGELSLQLTQVTLGGKTYPIVSDIWAHNGADKTIQSINSTAIGGGVGALIGAAAGGGAGAAIGAGVGGALGLGSSAASHSGQVYVPAEGLLTFHLTQPATVATVSQQEMDRLAQGVPGGAGQLQRRYPAPYYGPAYYRPYPYPY